MVRNHGTFDYLMNILHNPDSSAELNVATTHIRRMFMCKGGARRTSCRFLENC